MNFKCFVVFKKTCIILGGRRCKTFTPVFDPNQDRTEQTLPNFDNNTMLCWQLLPILFFLTKCVQHRQFGRQLQTKSGCEFCTFMMLLRLGAAFTASNRMVSESGPPPPTPGRMTPLRRPRDTLGGMQSAGPSVSPYPSDMMS